MVEKITSKNNKSKTPYPHPNFSNQFHITPSSHYHALVKSYIQDLPITLMVQW
jgi:hypothetical protein